MRKFFVLLVGTLFFAMGHVNAQDKPLVRYDKDAFLKVANKVDKNNYNTQISFAEKAFEEYLKYRGIKVDFTEADYQAAIHAHDTCAASFKKLLIEKNRLVTDKQTAMDRLRNSYTQVMAQKDDRIRDLIVERDTLESQKSRLEAANQTLNSSITSLTQDLQDLNKGIDVKKDSIRDLKAECARLRQENTTLTAQNQTVSEENANLRNFKEKFDGVFKTAETQINNIYNANKEKSCAEMKADDLQKALDASAPLKELQFMTPDIQNELNQITAWSNLKGALEEAVKYMEGKYNNATRNACISRLEKIKNLSGRQLDEKNTVLQALKDQAQVNAKFNDLLDYLRDGFFVISDKQVAQTALKLIDGQTISLDDNTTTIKVSPNAKYHKKHVAALQDLRSIMADAASKGPRKDLQDELGFQKVIENIRSKFQ